MLEPGAHDDSGIRTASGSRPPLSVAVLSLLGQDQPNTGVTGHHDDQIGGPSILTVLGGWQRTWWELEPSGVRPPASAHAVAPVVEWLVQHHQWAVVELGAYPEFAYEIGRISQVCMVMLSEQKDRPVRLPGRCPVPDMENDGVHCGAILMVSVGDTAIRCYRCGGVWPRHAWPLLGRLMTRPKSAAA